MIALFLPKTKLSNTYFEPFLKLNGTDFYDIENNDQLQLEEFTLATWFRTNQSCSCEPSHIVNKGGFNNEESGKNMNYGVWMNTDGTITAGFESQRGKNFEILSQKKYNDGKWHYVIVLYNSTVLRVDIDGNTIGNLKISKTPDTKGNQPLRVGANSLDLDKYFNGEVDEVRIWNRGLAINELSDIYTNRNFTTNGQVEYLDFGKNIINNDKEELIYNNSITKSTKEFQTTLGTTKQPQFIFVFVIPKDTLQELESGATKKQQPLIGENNAQTVKNDTSKTNNTKEELLATLTNKQQPPTIVENQTSSKPITTTNKQQPPTIVENQTSSKPITTTNKQQPPTIVENQTSSKPITTTNKQQPPTIVENQTSSKPITTTNKQQPPTIVENQTSNRITTEPTLLSNNTSNTANVKSDKINLVFENLSVNRSVTNSVEIKGEIKNNTPLDLQEIKISAEYYNKTGTLLAKVEHFISSPSYILKPNQLISFNILEVLGFGFDKLGDYNIFASGESIN